ncbi:unnamed protein product, partial [Mesorhabditis spiculigera]
MASAADINLDDIFGAPPSHPAAALATESNGFNHTYTSESRYESHFERHDSAVTTESSRHSEMSRHSTHSNVGYHNAHPIFKSVTLAPVEYTTNPRSYEAEALHHLDHLDQDLAAHPEPPSPAPQDHHDVFHPPGRDRVHTGDSTLSGRTESTIKDHESEEYDTVAQLEPRKPAVTDFNRRFSTLTIDSQISTAETRFGDFDVHDRDGKMNSQDLTLEHNEVAYERPKKKKQAPAAASVTAPVHTGDTWRLNKLNSEILEAKRVEALLEERVRLEKLELEALRQRQTHAGKTPSRNSSRTNSENHRRPSDHVYDEPYYDLADLHHSQQNNHQIHHNNNHHHHHHSRTNSTATSVPASIGKRSTKSSDSIIEEEVKISHLAASVRHHGHQVHGYAKNPKVRKFVFGGEQAPTADDKTVLLFGPAGSGKSSLIDSMLDYLYDVKRENPFRFVVSQHHAPTTELTAYEFNNTVLPFKFTIVDTPGIPDVKGTKTCSSLIQHWLKNELLAAGAFRLDAISIVLRHDEVNLGWPFIYELAAVRQMFGGDLKTNVLPIVTHSEVLPQPLAIRSLAQANISFVEYYKVNNAGFSPDPAGLSKLKHQLFHKHGMASLENYFKDLQEMIHPLLAVLRNSHQSPKSPVFETADLY